MQQMSLPILLRESDAEKRKRKKATVFMSAIGWSCVRKYIDTSAPPCPRMIGFCDNQKKSIVNIERELSSKSKLRIGDEDLLYSTTVL